MAPDWVDSCRFWTSRRLLQSRGAPTLVAILARSTHDLARVITGLLERAGEVELLGQLGVEDGARAEAQLHHQQLRSSKDSNTKGVVDAYDASPMATTAAHHAALFIRGKLVGRLNRLMAMHIAASSCRS
jgi:2-polyprenyl-6-methoxyphenol hydroxylase-like FAD-dependent oxidoreductase